MKYLPILLSLISAISFGLAIYFIFMNTDQFSNKIKHNKTIIVSLILLAISLVIIGFTIDYIIDIYKEPQDFKKDFSKIGTYGDFFGGILNPILAFIGIIAASLAFYAQYQANRQVQDQFKIQQFESQFYEMLHLHRENLNEMTIGGYVFVYDNNDKSKAAKKDSKKEKTTSGKKVFVTMLKEFEAIHLICSKVFMFQFELLASPQKEQVEILLKQFIFDHSYFVFFNGINLYKKSTDRYKQNDSSGFLNLVLDNFVRELEAKRSQHLESGIKEFHQYYTTGSVLTNDFKTNSLWLSFNYKPFSGHQSILAHYYRHLFQTVKFVAKQNNNLISYESKRDYLRVLRSMMSNQEQVLLLYNWYGGFGSNWEEKSISKRKNKIGNYFFTDYRMIHNIPPDLLIKEMNLNEIFNENFRGFLYEIDRKEEDSLFELINIISGLKN